MYTRQKISCFLLLHLTGRTCVRSGFFATRILFFGGDDSPIRKQLGKTVYFEIGKWPRICAGNECWRGGWLFELIFRIWERDFWLRLRKNWGGERGRGEWVLLNASILMLFTTGGRSRRRRSLPVVKWVFSPSPKILTDEVNRLPTQIRPHRWKRTSFYCTHIYTAYSTVVRKNANRTYSSKEVKKNPFAQISSSWWRKRRDRHSRSAHTQWFPPPHFWRGWKEEKGGWRGGGDPLPTFSNDPRFVKVGRGERGEADRRSERFSAPS